jgi:hypothetical protein
LAEYGAELWRAFVLVVALSTMAASASVVVREFRGTDNQNGDYPTIQAPSSMGGPIEASFIDRIPKVQ